FGARAGEGRLADRIGAVRHFHSAREAAILVAIGEVGNGVAVAQLEGERLAAHQPARARHQGRGGDAPGACAGEARVAHVDRIEHARRGLDRIGAVAARDVADVAVGIDQAGNDDAPGQVDALRVTGYAHAGPRTHRAYAAVVHHEHAILDRGAGDR